MLQLCNTGPPHSTVIICPCLHFTSIWTTYLIVPSSVPNSVNIFRSEVSDIMPGSDVSYTNYFSSMGVTLIFYCTFILTLTKCLQYARHKLKPGSTQSIGRNG